MSTFNLSDPVPLCTVDDLKPAEKPGPRKPVVPRLHGWIKERLDAVLSTGGQTMAGLPLQYNSYCVPLHSDHFKQWVVERYAINGTPVPSRTHLNEAIHLFESRAVTGSISGSRLRMHVRTGWDEMYSARVPKYERGCIVDWEDPPGSDFQPAMIYSLDTYCGKHVAITREGWSIQPTHIPFVYHPSQRQLPQPRYQKSDDPDYDPAPGVPDANSEPEIALKPLKKLLRLDHPQYQDSWQTLLNWILTAMKPMKHERFHSYPILNLVGKDISGKTVAAKLLSELIDPVSVPINSMPNTERQLHVLAAAQHLLAFDTPGKLNPTKADYLSRLSQGTGSTYRQFQGVLCRPIVLTTRTQSETKNLAHRIVDVELPPLQPKDIRPQGDIWEEFEKMRPQILAALFTLLSRRFGEPDPSLPNRRTKLQKLEESIPLLLEKSGGTWKGTAMDLQQALPFDVSLQLLGRLLKRTTSFQVSSKKNNNFVTLTICLL